MVRKAVPSSLPSQPPSTARKDIVVVLAVMYPNLPTSRGTKDGVPSLPSGVAGGQKTTNVIFYDPFSSIRNGGDPTQRGSFRAISRAPTQPTRRKKKQCSEHASRANALEAVARDLAVLSSKRRIQPPFLNST